MHIKALTDYLNEFLNCDAFHDYAPNGLQVSCGTEIKKIITGVSACQALLDAGVKANADAILVHHGYFWKGENPCVTGIKAQRLKTLLTHNINLLAYHLPLDANLTLGNNVLLGKALDFKVKDVLNNGLLYVGELTAKASVTQLQQHIAQILQREPQVVMVSDKPIESIAWCTGAAQDMIETAAKLGVDAFLSGEISERTYHLANEYGVNYFAAGHHATETFGIKALGKHLQDKFKLDVEFVDISNPV